LANSEDLALTIGTPIHDRIKAMTNMTMGLEQNEENLLTYQVSDEILETVGGKEIAANFTLGACTGQSVCDG
ncbi:MAG: hypothetical protein WCB52_10345, partial [Pseudolabrys sp.]